MTVITWSDGTKKKSCNGRCHSATTSECNCICEGRYHGATLRPGGLPHAIKTYHREVAAFINRAGIIAQPTDAYAQMTFDFIRTEKEQLT